MPARAAKPDSRAALRLWLRLLTCTNLIESRVRSRLRDEFTTTLPRFDMLAQLDMAAHELSDNGSHHGLTMSELSRRLMVSNGNVTGLANTLVREKLVKRTTGSDRRAQHLELTPAGKRSLDTMAAQHRRWIERMFAGLTPRETEQLHGLIGKLKDSVQEAM
jgi:DNA-binding MarR family transcriptional regulator